MAAMKKVGNRYLKQAANKGRDFRPSPGNTGGKIPTGTAGSGPRPTPAHNSGSKGTMPAPTHARTNLPIRKGV